MNGAVSDAYYYDKNLSKKPTFLSSSPSVFARVGVSLFLEEHHRIEFVTKIPIYTLNGNENIYKPLQFMLGYKFVF